MHRKLVFALAGVFLTVALVVPPVILLMQADNDLDNLIIIQNPAGLQTNGNATNVNPDEIAEGHQTNFIIIAIVEIVFVVLFVVTLYFGINQENYSNESPEK